MFRRKKIQVAILFGGKSAEHEVSLQSAKNVYEAIDKNKYDVELVRIEKDGRWEKPIVDFASVPAIQGADVVFPVLHGPFGEDGTVQGLLKLAGVPFVGAGVLGSAIGMDKDVTKRLLRDAGIPVAQCIVLRKGDNALRQAQRIYEKLAAELGKPFFVKPANLGSSVGVHKVKSEEQFKQALRDAFLYDTKVLAEEYIEGREIECAVLGNGEPIASLPGEVIPKHEFYSYEAKYIDENGAVLEIPAKLDAITVKKVQDTAVRAFKVLCCEGMARADFFLRADGKLFLNEVNTIPGFTKISMYPKLWEASGVSYAELIDRLIDLAIERFEREHKLKASRV
ncbi:MAG: D-alanine--D-alanine ligase family protein [Patescibacteria group bacterium]